MRFKKVVFIFFIFSSSLLYGQEPFHFFLGTDALSNVDIYGINQDSEGNYWLTTDLGLFSYDGYVFKKYTNAHILGSSLFNPKLDRAGNIYCNNLNGQIFRVSNGDMELFHEVPDSLLSVYVDFDFAPDGDLLVYSKGFYKVKNGQIQLLHKFKGDVRAQEGISTDCGGNALLKIDSKQLILRATPKGLEKVGLGTNNNVPFIPRKLYCHQGELIGAEEDNGGLVWMQANNDSSVYQPQKILDIVSNVRRLYIVPSGLYSPKDDLGVNVFNVDFNGRWSLLSQKTIMKNHFISTIYEDKEGNLLLGTFKQGLIIIPKSEVEEDILPKLNITELEASLEDELFLGDAVGNVFNVREDKLRLIAKSSGHKVERLQYFPYSKTLFFMSKEANAIRQDSDKYIKKKLPFTIKELVHIGGDRYVVATSENLKFVDLKKGKVSLLPQKLGRTYAIAQRRQRDFIVATSKGLVMLPNISDEGQFICYRGEKIIASSLENLNDDILIGTRKYGVLILKGNKIMPFISTHNGLKSDVVIKIMVKEEKIYISCIDGFQIFDKYGNLYKTLGVSDGLQSNKVSDFALSHKNLWILNQYGLNKIPLTTVFAEHTPSKIKEVYVSNDGKNINKLGLSEVIPYDKNRIAFTIHSPSLIRKHDLSYNYQLIGIDQLKRGNSYMDNNIVYNSLPPGQYTFKVDLLLNGKIQDSKEVEISIAKPYWMAWWFWLTIFVLLSITLFVYFKYRLNLLKKRERVIEELHSNKLMALQNQLSPHFIFNALISIQNYMFKNDALKAALYMGNFSKLMRQVLENSRVKFIALTEEVEMLTNYMELLQIQSETDFSYEIVIDDSIIDEEEIAIPPMFVQPFVENAIEHGIIKSNGEVRVTFEQIENLISIAIVDNGVGLSAKKEITEEKVKKHHSLATSIIRERIEVFNKKLGTDIELVVSEIKGANQSILGTKVILKVPFQMR